MSVPSLFGADELTARATIAPAPPSGDALPLETRSLYRKYRPQSFDAEELVGQEPVIRTLRNAIRLGRIAHAYLFCGPRGTGKTTTARVLAKAVNCLDPDPACRPCNVCNACRAIATGATTDVIEIDAASNRGIDDIRELRERVKYAPTQLRVKFYIIDEAHQITGAAANAFLKTLEEPPDHTKFVLATTDPEEILPTIVSRCQRFDFRRIGLQDTIRRLRGVAAAEGLTVDDDAMVVIARHATGSLRDALGLLDQLALYRDHDHEQAPEGESNITAEMVRALLGVSRNDRVETLVLALAERDATTALATVNAAIDAGEEPRELNRQLVLYLRLLLHQRAGGSPDADERARALATRFDLGELADLARRFSEIDYKIKRSTYGQLPLEVALIEGVLRHGGAGSEGQTVVTAPPPRADITPPPASSAGDGTPTRPPTRPLRDRIRGESAVSASSAPALPSPPPTPRPVERPRPASLSNGVTPLPLGTAPIIELDRLVDLWPRIRQDVKAVNRRIEALLTSIDPARVDGNHITLVTSYPFHRDKLNTDECRGIVEQAIGHLVGTPVQISCLLREEITKLNPPLRSAEPGPARPPDPVSGGAIAESGEPVDDQVNQETAPIGGLEADEQRLRAALNIFDAEVIKPGE